MTSGSGHHEQTRCAAHVLGQQYITCSSSNDKNRNKTPAFEYARGEDGTTNFCPFAGLCHVAKPSVHFLSLTRIVDRRSDLTDGPNSLEMTTDRPCLILRIDIRVQQPSARSTEYHHGRSQKAQIGHVSVLQLLDRRYPVSSTDPAKLMVKLPATGLLALTDKPWCRSTS